MSRHNYSEWDGTQNPWSSDMPIDEIVAEFSEDLLAGWGAQGSIRRLLDEGVQSRFGGLRSMRDRLDHLREAGRAQPKGEDILSDIRERLDHIVEMERLELSLDDGEAARFKEVALDALPAGVARQIAELGQYDFASRPAGQDFRELVDELRAQMLEQQFANISEALGSVTQEDLSKVKDMLADLNVMLDEYRAGIGPSPEAFEDFIDKHGEFFPENPQNIEELLEVLATRAAAFSRFVASLPPNQQRELAAMSSAVLDDLDLQFQMDQLGRSLRALAPGQAWDVPSEARGEGSGLAQSLAAIEQASDMDELDRLLKQDYPGASIEDIDPDLIGRLLGEDVARDLDKLRQIERALQEAGVISRSGGKVELTPRGVRKLGERALSRVFEDLTHDQPGSHDVFVGGGDGDLTGSTRAWRHGDAFRLDLRRTVHNAVLREGRTQGRVKLKPEDFEIAEAEQRTSVATVLLLDMSRSMPLRGHWLPAKRMALALHSLISMQYPEDKLEIVGFSDYARPMTPAALGEIDWEPVYGTNMEHAFNLAGRMLAKHRDATKQVLLVTDGEPTAHLVGDQVFFQWPPAWETIEKTLREALRLARSGVTMNIFMLEQNPSLSDFVDKLARVVKGRVFAVQASSDIGEMVVRDYMRRR